MLALPVNVKDIISGHTVEWERLEYTIEFSIHRPFREAGDICKDTGQTESTQQVTPQVGTKSGLSRDQVLIIPNLLHEKKISELLVIVGRSNRTKFRDQVLRPLIDSGLVEMTIPDKPNSRLQKYRLTEKGKQLLNTPSAVSTVERNRK
jgi:predicted transcriptional regulator